MIEDDQTVFADFIVEKMNEEIPKIIEEYGDGGEKDKIYNHILNAVISYTKYAF